tara:strand:- start:590 stop:1591 length:1002 start_codon:yes stop_codon:yes gene_type:complete
MANLFNKTGFGKQANALARNAKSQLSSSINSVKSSLGFGSDPHKNYLSKESEDSLSPLIYPLDLDFANGYHGISFRVDDRDNMFSRSIYFPCPPNISFNDSATYSTIDLNTIGNIIKNEVDSGASNRDLATITAGVLKSGGEAVRNLKTAEIAKAVGSSLPIIPESIRGTSRVLGRRIFNPNTNTTFTGNSIRSFIFSFKMVASSAEESRRVNDIHRLFRKYVYADSDPTTQNLILRFPPKWHIRFPDRNGSDNTFIPRIYECYLVSVETNFNSTTNAFHADGAPLEVDMSLTYQETRVLTRADIENMAMYKTGGGIDIGELTVTEDQSNLGI